MAKKHIEFFKKHLKKPLDNGRLDPRATLASNGPSLDGFGFYEYNGVERGKLPHNEHIDFLQSDNEELWEFRSNNIVPDYIADDPLQPFESKVGLRQKELDYYTEYPIDYSVNKMGFRGPGYPEKGAKHIFFLGDSHVSGVGLHYKHTVSGYLNDYYTSLGYRFVNMGVHGSGLETCYRLLAYYTQIYDVEKVFVFSPHPYRYEYRQPLIVPKNKNSKLYTIDDTKRRNFGTRGLGNIQGYGMNDFMQRVLSDDVNTYVKDLRALDAMYGNCSVKNADMVRLVYPWPAPDRTYIKPVDNTLNWLRARDYHWDHQMHFYLANKFIHSDINKEYYNPMNKPAFGDMYSPDSGDVEGFHGWTFKDEHGRFWRGLR